MYSSDELGIVELLILMYHGRGASSNDTIGMVYVRNSRSRLQTELIIYFPVEF